MNFFKQMFDAFDPYADATPLTFVGDYKNKPADIEDIVIDLGEGSLDIDIDKKNNFYQY